MWKQAEKIEDRASFRMWDAQVEIQLYNYGQVKNRILNVISSRLIKYK